MSNKILEKWEWIGFIIAGVILVCAVCIEFFLKCIITEYPTIVSIVVGLAGSYIATISVLYFERRHQRTTLKKYYSKYVGQYKRSDIGRDNASEEELATMKQDNNALDIQMKYLGDHEFSIDVNYWRSKNAKAEGYVEFNPKNKQSAKGYYRYIAGSEHEGQYGSYDLLWDAKKNEMIVIYHHLFPRTSSSNPDDNRGWEVWVKQ